MNDTYTSFDGNENLKPTGVVMHLTADQVIERMKCEDDVLYFIENYVKIVKPGSGLIQFQPYPYQKKLAKLVDQNKFVICKFPRQCGKSTILSGVIAWMLLFSKTTDMNIMIAAHKSSAAMEIIRKVKTAIEYTPKFLQQGIKKWNSFSLELENGNRCTSSTTAADTGRSGSYDLILLDEFAFVKPNIAEEFYTSSYPTISANPKSKVVIISTPNGMNLFYDMWTKATNGHNEFKPIEIKWDDVPGRDESFKRETIANLGTNGSEKWAQEYECLFQGGASALIPSHAIIAQEIKDHIKVLPPDGVKVFKEVEPNAQYMITVDTSRGRGLDFSAFTVIKISELPYEVVATFRQDDIDPMYYPTIIKNTAKIYNDAYCLIETNDLGETVAKTLFNTLEYENVLSIETKPHKGQVLTGVGGQQLGVTTSAKTKSVGCSTLKALCENLQIKVYDYDIIVEMSNFTRVGSTYKAQKGNHDDLMMTLVLFAWATTQAFFQDMTNIDIRNVLYADRIKRAETELIPFGYMVEDGNFNNEDMLFTDDF